jgi:hypothetical protein
VLKSYWGSIVVRQILIHKLWFKKFAQAMDYYVRAENPKGNSVSSSEPMVNQMFPFDAKPEPVRSTTFRSLPKSHAALCLPI